MGSPRRPGKVPSATGFRRSMVTERVSRGGGVAADPLEICTIAPMDETADHDLRAIATRIAHDLNNLFGVIGNYALFVHDEVSAAASGDLGGPWALVIADVERIRVAVQHAARLTDELQAAAHSNET